MQKRKLKPFKNLYCDAFGLALGEFVDIYSLDEYDIMKNLTQTDMEKMCEYAVLKNLIAGVGELNLKVPFARLGRKFLDKYNLAGSEILSARLLTDLTAEDLVGGRVMLELESLLEYKEGFLSNIVDFSATTFTPLLVKVGQTLEEVGKVVNKFNRSPIEVLEDYGFLDRKCFIYGLNFIDKDDQKLLQAYQPTLILSPQDDAESGRGGINLYNFIFNGLKFAFASGKCYNVNMFLEGKLALYNTANLMYERGLVRSEDVLNALQCENGEIEIDFDDETSLHTILDKRVEIEDNSLKTRYFSLREEIKDIARKIKEKI